MSWYLRVLQKYFDFSGRAQRKEFWMFVLIDNIIKFFLAIFVEYADSYFLGALYLLYFFATIVPYLAVYARRLHDTGRSIWYMLISFVPLINLIFFLAVTTTDGDPAENQYGPNPKALG
jgi:uncharacterized membrane protein YhaH (DUF805 family)